MKLTDDESRALAFIAGLLLLSIAVRVGAAREPVAVRAAAGFDVAGHVEATRAAVSDAERAARPLEPGERINPNTAEALELDRLPGVGPALAARIIEDRVANGPFRSAADLTRVRGVGARMLEKMAPHLALPAGTAAGRNGGARGAPGRETRPAARDATEAPVVDLNRADAQTLATLPGIGPVLAARIVAYRDSAGPFPDVGALVAVRGVGPATVKRLEGRARGGGT